MSQKNYILAFDTANEVIAVGVGKLERETATIKVLTSCETPAFRASNTKLIAKIDAALEDAGYFLASISWLSVILMCLCTAGLFALSSPQQVLLIRFSPGGEMLGAASVQVAFNLGNAIGAYCGGLPLQAGLSYRYPALLGTFFALVGFILLVLFSRKYETARQHV